MTEQYSQCVEVAVSGKTKASQWIGVSSLLISLGFIVLSAFYSWYLMFGFGIFAAIGALELHIFNATAKEYIYNFNPQRLVVAKKDMVNRTRRVASVLFEDAMSFAPLEGFSDDTDLMCCSSASDAGVYALDICADGETRRLLLAPDEYMTELISSAIIGAKERKAREERGNTEDRHEH